MKTLLQAVREHPFFHGLPMVAVDAMAEGAIEQSYKEGEIILREGEPANRFYLIVSGRVAIEAHQPGDGSMPIQQIHAGDVMGWSWLVPPYSWHFQARALEPTRAIVLNGAHILVTAEEDKVFGYELMKRIAQVVVRRLQATRRQLTAKP